MPSYQPKRFLIKCPAALISAYALPSTLTETADGTTYLRLLVAPGDYSAINDQAGEGTRLVDTFTGVRLVPAAMRRSPRIAVKDDRAELRAIIEELADLSVSTIHAAAPVPLEARDYVRPEYADVKAARQATQAQAASLPPVEPFTVRYGFIPQASIEGGGLWRFRGREDRHQEGWSFKFVETELRRD